MENSTIRLMEEKDIPAVLEIYTPYITDTVVTYEEEIPSLTEFTLRVKAVTEQFPWLVCEQEGIIIGYAYASRYHSRAAFDWDCECSIYLADCARGKGIGKRLYQVLLVLLEQMGYYNAYGVISYPNEQSVALHEALGFEPMGIHTRVGFKFNEWHDLYYCVKRLQKNNKPTEKPRSIHSLSERVKKL